MPTGRPRTHHHSAPVPAIPIDRRAHGRYQTSNNQARRTTTAELAGTVADEGWSVVGVLDKPA